MPNKQLNILLLSGTNLYTNSGILTFDIFKSLQKGGHNITCITRDYDSRFEDGIYSIRGKKESYIRNIILRIGGKINQFKKRNPFYYMYSMHDKKNHIAVEKILKSVKTKVDVILYVFPHRFLDSRDLYELNQKTGAPVFVMPVDMAQFTGGCHYANDCKGYKTGCGKCPGIYSSQLNDQTNKNLLYKARYLSKANMAVVSNTWLNTRAKQSFLYSSKPIFNLDVVVNENHYCTGNKENAKAFFSIPMNKSVIFFGSATLQQKRKGLSYLVEALSQLYLELNDQVRAGICIAIAGEVPETVRKMFMFDTYLLGHLSHETLPKAFQMAEVFVSPSIQDAGPMMVAQSMMCGTPVVAFETGNAEDFIFDDQTGYRVPLYDIIGLKNGILKLLSKTKEEKRQINENCRSLAVTISSYSVFSNRFLSVFDEFSRDKNNRNRHSPH